MQSAKRDIGRRGLIGENIITILLWIIFLTLASGAVWLIVKKLTS